MNIKEIKKLVRPNIAALKPYVCARYGSVDGIFLDANENPYGDLNRYPDPLARDLRAAIGKYCSVEIEEIFASNGSDEAIDLLIRAFCEPGVDNIYVKKPTYGMYDVAAAINNVSVSDEIDKNTKLIFLCSPNNPTGEIISDKDVVEFCKNYKAIVVVDQAYIEFAGQNFLMKKFQKYPNLVILRTFSKALGAAAIRLGYAICNPFIKDTLNKIKYPYNLNSLSQMKGINILKNQDKIEKQIAKIVGEKKRVASRLKSLGLKVWSSEANFLLFEIPRASEMQELLQKKGVNVRDRSEDIENTIRVTIGKASENNLFLKELEGCMDKIAFIDRDGTLIFEPQDDFQVDTLKKYRILPGVISGLKALLKRNYKLVMVTNQNGIGSPSFPKKNFDLVQNRFIKDLKKEGIQFVEVFVCPHFPKDKCECRKPKIGMVEKFLKSTAINFG
ncbi:MAG: histidinol-phosphate transaminase, partial [bacterium]|nr:histidinol-phosphate transaminase [bacterium]